MMLMVAMTTIKTEAGRESLMDSLPTFEKSQIYLAFYSLIRTFAADYVNGRPESAA